MKLSLVACLTAALFASSYADAAYYRSPALQNDQLVFTAEGDLWLSQLSGGDAKRLTTHPAEETQALFTPDGKAVVYVAAYDDTPDIYYLSLTGGSPKRLTAHNAKVKLQGWSLDGKLLYSTDAMTGPVNSWVLKLMDIDSQQTETLPLLDAVEAVLDHQNGYVYFIRYGLQLTGDNARQYQGGAKGQLWRWKLGSVLEAERLLTDHQGSLRNPMLWQGQLVLVSDAGGNANLWSYDPVSAQLKELTTHQDFAVRSARLDQGKVAYQLGADIQLLDLSSGQNSTQTPALVTDSPQQRQRLLTEPLKYLTSSSVGFAKEKLILTLRSKVQVLSRSPQRSVELAVPETARARSAVISQDGNWVYLISDQSGEPEIWQYAADGSDKGKQLTKDGRGFRWNLALSPDGRYLAHDDKQGQLWVFDLKTQSNQLVHKTGFGLGPYSDMVWNNSSTVLAFTAEKDGTGRQQIGLYSLKEQQAKLLTTDKYNSYSPAFHPDGDWLYFLSERELKATPGSPWGDRNMGPAFDKRSQVFAYALTSSAQFPFEAETELTAGLESQGKAVSLKDLPGQLWQVPVVAGNYQKLQVSSDYVYLHEFEQSGDTGSVRALKIEPENKKLLSFAGKVRAIQSSADGKRLFLQYETEPGKYRFFLGSAAAKAPEGEEAEPWAIDKISLTVTPKAEWQQMFHDAWLMHREFLFDPAMRGVDWGTTKRRYQPLLERVTDRFELDDLLAQLIGELSVLHSQVRGGDYAKASESSKAASLGGEFVSRDGKLILQTIYQTDPDLPSMASPLNKAGVGLKTGDHLLAVNGKAVASVLDLHQVLQQQQGQQVLLQLERNGKALKKVVVPVSPQQEQMLRYQHWVQQKKQQVEQQGKQQLGYLHLYAMTASDISNFAREFYANVDKPGLIIDVRRNRGGNIDSWVIEKLLRRVWAFWQPTQGKAYSNMQQSFRGQLVVLTDPLTYSDGETFAAGIKSLGLGPVVGQQTAGAGVWLSGRNLLADMGVARVAETAQFDKDGRWIIEGRGVSPDLLVDNLPYASFNGQDAQLSYAISLLQKQLQEKAVPELKAEPVTPGIAKDAQKLNW
ncbi:MAG: PDZ domain-containing protein [Gammaproteobacteria bacterium]|nr:PDZ domain-containing protein [Gammaproteobacteria bacterium]MBU2058813.1 PDZ domain-containing protein [Gammaproteobacteria bacterium]MBU2177124.1 PDZ domain-containing protein [Gammaproteobacteria bacterium]MBU2247110.1 PDZ domain-containing protein [Gammaproteobacteria bacterium]MBU2343602.1 PDZ domain-containing protein [Gammaproteobacteria bacterium]